MPLCRPAGRPFFKTLTSPGLSIWPSTIGTPAIVSQPWFGYTFACDGIPDRVDEPEAWVRAREIARDTLDGKLWLADVGKATHYHAYWVRLIWIREMQKLDRIGVHTFYRPRNWGDGAAAPVWGDEAATKEAVKKL